MMAVRSQIGLAVCAMLIVAVQPAAHASPKEDAVSNIIKFYQFLGDLDEMGGQVTDGLDLLFKLGPEVEQHVEELEKRALSFRAPNYVVPAPKLKGDQVFSSDPQMRDNVLNGWMDFVAEEKLQIERLKERRAAQESDSTRISRKLEYVGKIKTIEEEISRNPQWGLAGLVQYEAAKKTVELDVLEGKLNSINNEYKRIFRQYNAVVVNKQVDYGAHTTILHFLESLKSGPPLVSGTDRTAVENRINAAVDNNGGWLIYKADQLTSALARQRAALDRIQSEGTNSLLRSSSNSPFDNPDSSGTGSGSASHSPDSTFRLDVDAPKRDKREPNVARP